MAAKLNPSKEADEFSLDLASIQSRVEDEAHMYAEMPQEGKRKCLDDLENTIQTLRKIEKNLKGAEEVSPDKNLIQVLWGAETLNPIPPTKKYLEGLFKELDFRGKLHIPTPIIKSVVTQDNFKLDDNKHLQPMKMCFVQFSTPEDVYMMLGPEKTSVEFRTEWSQRFDVEFIKPTQNQATHTIFRSIAKSLTRLEEIQKELKKIGAMRRNGGMPVLKDEFMDKSHYATELEKLKATRASGKSLEGPIHGMLSMGKPVDTEALKKHIKTLYDEECDILIKLREYQLNGVDFNFNH